MAGGGLGRCTRGVGGARRADLRQRRCAPAIDVVDFRGEVNGGVNMAMPAGPIDASALEVGLELGDGKGIGAAGGEDALGG